MRLKEPRFKINRRSALVALGIAAVVIAWALVFYLPQTHKLAALDAQRTSLQASVATDEARLQSVMKEAQHVTQIRAMYNQLEGYAPAAENLYTYIHTIASAAKAAGVAITSLEPNPLSATSGVGYSAIPITASVKGTYDHLLAFIKNLYNLPRLTDVNAVAIAGGGPGSSRNTILTASLQLAIFTSQTATAAVP